MLPNFFVVGTQKAGTTSLHNYLSAHPDIYVPVEKETKFFARPDRYAAGIDSYEKTYFAGHREETAVGEVDPDYMFYEEALERMASDMNLDAVRFIFLLRNPVERAYSHYLMSRRRGHETLSFSEAIRQEEKRISSDYFARNRFSYVSRGIYLPQIKRFAERVDRQRILLLLSEDLDRDPETIMERCFEFLNVDEDIAIQGLHRRFHGASLPKSDSLAGLLRGDSPLKRFAKAFVPTSRLRQLVRRTAENLNQSTGLVTPMSATDRGYLQEVFRPHNAELERYSGLDLRNWN